MNSTQFFYKVKDMRAAQRTCEKMNHSQDHARYRRRLEREIDEEIARVEKVLEDRHPKIFENL